MVTGCVKTCETYVTNVSESYSTKFIYSEESLINT